MDRGALDHPLEAGSGRSLGPLDVGDQRVKLLVEEGDHLYALGTVAGTRASGLTLSKATDLFIVSDLAEEELTAPEPESVADPAVAKAGDRLANGFTVVKRLARTATSCAC